MKKGNGEKRVKALGWKDGKLEIGVRPAICDFGGGLMETEPGGA